MNERRKKIMVILFLAVIIFGYSLYDFADKNTTKKEPLPLAGAAVNAMKPVDEGIVYVSGAVNKPGIFKLPPNSRVFDAINTAGGFTARADSEKINLAQPVKDGQQINVPSLTKPPLSTAQTGGQAAGQPAGQPAGQAGEKPAAKPVSINTASEKELQELPGIGPAMAKRIIDYRSTNGSFGEISELRRVAGIGEARFNNLKSRITL